LKSPAVPGAFNEAWACAAEGPKTASDGDSVESSTCDMTFASQKTNATFISMSDCVLMINNFCWFTAENTECAQKVMVSRHLLPHPATSMKHWHVLLMCQKEHWQMHALALQYSQILQEKLQTALQTQPEAAPCYKSRTQLATPNDADCHQVPRYACHAK
jgi:hypothetical protein